MALGVLFAFCCCSMIMSCGLWGLCVSLLLRRSCLALLWVYGVDGAHWDGLGSRVGLAPLLAQLLYLRGLWSKCFSFGSMVSVRSRIFFHDLVELRDGSW